ncbi:hypothetical protein BJ508DRAFT_416570 [Ascobolus immersus RN42]|uniref:F-box domain-containing protein n=1 Tax=Ascobolus immersus RN42 TaxID=1160509 RepID=A0A3N4HWS9_ASCIM|nr:hypothetical protein BJ508DRAFT_416570 [Ascobolus immersus RN42]
MAVNSATLHLLTLPPELRLDIYRQCSAFTLLQLSHTCTHLRSEINACPAIIRAAPGLSCSYSRRCLPVADYAQPRLPSHSASSSSPLPNLSILNIKHISDPSEHDLFWRLHVKGSFLDYRDGRHILCEGCDTIVLEVREKVWESNDSEEWRPKGWKTSCSCPGELLLASMGSRLRGGVRPVGYEAFTGRMEKGVVRLARDRDRMVEW